MPETEKGLRSHNGRWELPLVGAVVIQVRIDFAFGLVMQGGSGEDGSCEVRISSPFDFDSGGGPVTIDPEHTRLLAPLIRLHNAVIEQAFVLEDGYLELGFEGDRTIRVPPAPNFEAWGLTVTNRSVDWSTGLVSLPGSGTATYDTSPSPAPELAPRITIVHTRTGMLLTKEHFRDWREVQDRFDDYMTSLGPYTPRELLDYLAVEYPKDPPFTHESLTRFAQSDQQHLWWHFHDPN